MTKRASARCSLAVFLVCSLWSLSAWSWIETTIRGHRARVEVAENGWATVHHELTLKVRGGPMKSLEISGIGTDVEPLPDATVRRAVEGSSGQWPLSVASMEDGAVRLNIGADRGIRGGNYVFAFGYRVDFRASGALRATAEGVLVEWVGPRLSGGVDSARVTFVLPKGASPPTLREETDGSEAQVLLGEVRRGTEADEIDLVRAHLATGEPAVWSVAVDNDALRALVASDQASASVSAQAFTPPARAVPVQDTAMDWRAWLAALVLALSFASVLGFKQRALNAAARLTCARLLPVLPLPPVVRVVFGGLAMFSYVLAAWSQQLWLAVGALACCLLSGTQLLPVRRVVPRGPGRWEPLSEDFRAERVLPGAWLDGRSLRGASVLVIALGLLCIAALRIVADSNYWALMLLLGGLVLAPLFLTGGRRDFPRAPTAQAEPWLRGLRRAFDPDIVQFELWGRRAGLGSEAVAPAGNSPAEIDECRVRILPRFVAPGLKAFELTLEESAGPHVRPCVLLRVLCDSPAQARLPADVAWRRGRNAEERVALLRPAAPTLAQTVRLVRSLQRTLGAPRSEEDQRRRFSSSGRGTVTSKGVMPSGEPRSVSA